MKYNVEKLRKMHDRAHAAYAKARDLHQAAKDYEKLMTLTKPPFQVGETVVDTGYIKKDSLWIVKKIEVNCGCNTGWQVMVEPADRCDKCGRSDFSSYGPLSSGHFERLKP